MKKLFALLLAMMMLFSLAACGNNETPSGSKGDKPGASQGGENNDIAVKTATIDGYELPAVALAYVGTFNKAYNDYHRDAEAHFYVKSKDADKEAFNALVDYYASNGGTLDEEMSGSASKHFDFEWGRIEVAHFGVDKEISAFIIVPEYPIADNGGEENSGTTEPNNTGNNTENNEVDTWTVESFLKLYGFDAEALKPNHFTSFEELEIVESAVPGKRDNKGIVKISVEKGKTTADDYNAWFENLYAKMTELSDDGKLWYTGGKAMEAPTLEDLKAEAWWTTRPGSTCYITVNENGKSTRINLDYSYDLEAEQYKVIILVHSVS